MGYNTKPVVLFAQNTAKKDTTVSAFFFVLHGREAEPTQNYVFTLVPDDLEEDCVKPVITMTEQTRPLTRINSLRAQEKDQNRSNAKHRTVFNKLGDVWIFKRERKVGISDKLLKQYFGPYQVMRQLPDVTYEVVEYDPTPRR